MQQAVTKCLSVNIKFLKIVMLLLLDSSSTVSLVHQNYFDGYLRSKLGPAKVLETNAHQFVNLKVKKKVIFL